MLTPEHSPSISDKLTASEKIRRNIERALTGNMAECSHSGHDFDLETPNSRYTFIETDYDPGCSGGGGSDPMFGYIEPTQPTYIPSSIHAGFKKQLKDGSFILITKTQGIQKDGRAVKTGGGGFLSPRWRRYHVKPASEPNTKPRYKVLIFTGKNAESIKPGDNTRHKSGVKLVFDSSQQGDSGTWAKLAEKLYEEGISERREERQAKFKRIKKGFKKVIKDFPSRIKTHGVVKKAAEVKVPYDYSNASGFNIQVDVPDNDMILKVFVKRKWDEAAEVVTKEQYSIEFSLYKEDKEEDDIYEDDDRLYEADQQTQEFFYRMIRGTPVFKEEEAKNLYTWAGKQTDKNQE